MKHEPCQNQTFSEPPFDISTVTKEEIIRHFDWCDFRDQVGHKLTMNQDFHDLLARIPS